MTTTCAGCGQPIKPMRGAPGYWVHASRTTASCDLDADHVPGPDWGALGPVPCRTCGEPVTGGDHGTVHVDASRDADHPADPLMGGSAA